MNKATERVVDRIRRMVEHRRQMCLFRDGTVIHGLDKTHAVLTAVLADIDAACPTALLALPTGVARAQGLPRVQGAGCVTGYSYMPAAARRRDSAIAARTTSRVTPRAAARSRIVDTCGSLLPVAIPWIAPRERLDAAAAVDRVAPDAIRSSSKSWACSASASGRRFLAAIWAET